MSNNRPVHIIIISMIIYIVLNIIENIIYYNGGKFGLHQNIDVYFTIPKKKDLIILIVIMLFFAFLQGLMTVLFS
jgi:hypothetical protein